MLILVFVEFLLVFGLVVRYTFRMVLSEDFVLPDFSGFVVRGIVYSLIGEVNRGLAERLHQAKRLAPFSTTPFNIEHVEADGGKTSKKLGKGGILTWSLSFLDEELAKNLMDFLACKTDVMVGDVKAYLHEVNVESVDGKQLFREAESVSDFSITFNSPTFFRRSLTRECCPFCPVTRSSCRHIKSTSRHYRFIPLPDPYLMLRSLLRLWMAYSNFPIKNHREYIEWLKSGGVTLAGYSQLKTVKVYEHPTTPKWSIGFIGKAYFNLPKDTYTKEMAKITDALLKFGEYSNLGGNRTAGFGCINYQPKQHKTPTP